MKLKERLAKEYTDALPAKYTEGSKELIAIDFIAGFEQALELLVTSKGRTGWVDEKVSEIRLIGEGEV